MYDKATHAKKLPEGTPDPFRERRELVSALVESLAAPRGGRRIGISDGFHLKGLFPFFATFFHALGFDLEIPRLAPREALKRGSEGANVPWCAPMQQYHGVMAALAEQGADFLFAPMLREIPRVDGERAAQLCPISQASSDVLRCDLRDTIRGRLVSTVIDVGLGNLEAPQFVDSCRRAASAVGIERESAWRDAFEAARSAQRQFDDRLLDFGDAALEACVRDRLLPVVVLGRTYTIHDDVLNSNVPAILRSQGALPIPIDCYRVHKTVPVFDSMYWGYGQRMLRAAWQIRRTPNVFTLLASNYSCGPDSFTQTFVQDLMLGKPFAVIETDGHSGDAGTKTRIEAFLHCVREYVEQPCERLRDAERLTVRTATFADVAAANERVLIPTMSDAAEVLGAALRGAGLHAEVLPEPDTDAIRLGRRHTSGKECLPMVLTLGSLLQRLERERDTTGRFAFVMPSTDGPCRFGMYKEMHQLVLERTGWTDRVRIWSPPFGDYFRGIAPGLGALVFTGVVSMDVLRDLRYGMRPREIRAGAADAIYTQYLRSLVGLIQREATGDLSAIRTLREAATGRLWGIRGLIERAAREFVAINGAADLPVVLLTGEIYLRNVPSANGSLVEALEQRGIRARVSAVSEFLQYSDWIGLRLNSPSAGKRLDSLVRRRIERVCHGAAGKWTGAGVPPPVRHTVAAANPWVHDALEGETILTVGAAVDAWRSGAIDGVLSVGPLECMPNKIAESQMVHVCERERMVSLALSLNGDPIDPETLDAFALAVHERHRVRAASLVLAQRP